MTHQRNPHQTCKYKFRLPCDLEVALNWLFPYILYYPQVIHFTPPAALLWKESKRKRASHRAVANSMI
jgi:hypothetical protein